MSLRRSLHYSAQAASLAIAGFLAGYLLGPRPMPARPPAVAPDRAVTQSPMLRHLGEMHLDNVTMTELGRLLHDRAGMNVVVACSDPEMLATPMEIPPLDLRDPTAAQLIDIVTSLQSEVGVSTDRITMVGPTEQIGKAFESTHVYPIGDLLADRRLWSTMNSPDHLPADRNPADCLAHLICDHISPDTWRDSGGSVGSLRTIGDNLIVTQLPVAHDQIADLLEDLRRVADSLGAAAARARVRAAPEVSGEGH